MKKNILSKELKGERMLYDPVRDELHVLNATARRIYDLHKEGKGVDEIEVIMRNEFGQADSASLKEDIQNCLDGLKEKELI